jgi:hypothetical protein
MLSKRVMALGATSIGKKAGSLWEWLPATIISRQPAFADSFGGHEMPLPQESNQYTLLLAVDFAQHPADVGQTSSALGVLYSALAGAQALGGEDLLENERAPVLENILLDVPSRVIETIADHISSRIDHERPAF